MANSWVDNFPGTARPFLDEMDDTLGFNLSRTIANGPNCELNKTENSQPAIMATSILILRILEKEFGFDTKSRVNVTLGHSLGEFSALVAGGYLKFRDALRLVRRRAEIMAECTRQASKQSGEDYGMVALIFMIANINSKNQIVLSGSIHRITTLLIQLRQFGGHDPRAVRLKSESPFHNPIMAPAAGYMRHELEHIDIEFPSQLPCISNVSGLPFESRDDLKNLLSRQCVETVKWWDSIRYLDQDRGVKRWIGIGPGKVGRNLVGKEVGKINTKGGGVWALSDPRELENVLMALQNTEIDVLTQ
ncbi:malonyl CoA-acyl carrier protein transacylase, putative [Aspergillus fumigatus A1163]|uniref:[acyl-carrier-protein] S-malonyltransferase n=2 Tax=Aspergillus fumigatus TaxID=746128 RepID=Q4WNI3_ASPFU|nr:malonyl CoA-acyl carrier protein transacylase, putative [Aspergillus fumigatus Af293]EAL90201.1 malonyl CoA-acyl carrier protein transacylase, putative [Aspergillus fumigatus Af293]EDP49961.1 malonyl CoA-acyl carrier protein transacylase, putative [Aspergillus fumigatus A1163]